MTAPLEAQIRVKLDVEESVRRSEIEKEVEERETREREKARTQEREEDVTPGVPPPDAVGFRPGGFRGPGFGTGVGIGAIGADAWQRIQREIQRAQSARHEAESAARDVLGKASLVTDGLGVLASAEEAMNPTPGGGVLRALENRMRSAIAEIESALDSVRPAIERSKEITKASLLLGGDLSGSEVLDMLVEDYQVERTIARTSRLRNELARQTVMREFVKGIGQGRFFR